MSEIKSKRSTEDLEFRMKDIFSSASRREKRREKLLRCKEVLKEASAYLDSIVPPNKRVDRLPKIKFAMLLGSTQGLYFDGTSYIIIKSGIGVNGEVLAHEYLHFWQDASGLGNKVRRFCKFDGKKANVSAMCVEDMLLEGSAYFFGHAFNTRHQKGEERKFNLICGILDVPHEIELDSLIEALFIILEHRKDPKPDLPFWQIASFNSRHPQRVSQRKIEEIGFCFGKMIALLAYSHTNFDVEKTIAIMNSEPKKIFGVLDKISNDNLQNFTDILEDAVKLNKFGPHIVRAIRTYEKMALLKASLREWKEE